MVALRKPFWLARAGDIQRGTAAAFKVGARVHKKTGGANEKLKEAVRLSRERIKAE